MYYIYVSHGITHFWYGLALIVKQKWKNKIYKLEYLYQILGVLPKQTTCEMKAIEIKVYIQQ